MASWIKAAAYGEWVLWGLEKSDWAGFSEDQPLIKSLWPGTLIADPEDAICLFHN